MDRSKLNEILIGNTYLRGADLRNAYLKNADLRNVNLRDANLRGADLGYANLGYANLRNANLRNVNLRNADLRNADLRFAYLTNANLGGADLRNANLRNADLKDADLTNAILPNFQKCPSKGIEFKGYKKLENGFVIEVIIPSHADRTSCLINNKCRASSMIVHQSGTSRYDHDYHYKIGENFPDSYDPDIRIERTHGLHFAMTYEEAEKY
jgi:uncharacterized protein YjbI with pentapeptide repeats